MPYLARILGLSALAACDLAGPERFEQLELAATDVRALVVVAAAGDIAVVGDPDVEEIVVEVTIHGDCAELRHTRDGDALTLSHDCCGWSDCVVDWTIVAPADLAVELETGAGDLKIRGVAGDVRLETGAGDISLTAVIAPTLVAQTGAGDVTGHDLRSADVHAETGAGDLVLELADRPASVWWSSGFGDVDVALPGGRYRLDVETGFGEVELSGIDRSDAADAALRLHTGFGDIAVADPG
jgi:hypothetical protein